VHRAVRVAEFKTDRDVFNDDEASVWKSVDKPLEAMLETHLVVRQS
jgi:hypothetical protein